MENRPNETQGVFEVIDSFSIRRRKQFYLIGELIKGEIEENWYINVPFNSSAGMTLKINAIEEIEMTADNKIYKLLIIDCKEEGSIDLFLTLSISSEYLQITIDGVD